MRSTSMSASLRAAMSAPDSRRTSSQTPNRPASSSSSRTWRRSAPQIVLEDLRQLASCGQRDEFPAVLETARLYDSMEQGGWQAWDDLLEMGRLHDALEQRSRISGDRRYRHAAGLAPCSPDLGFAPAQCSRDADEHGRRSLFAWALTDSECHAIRGRPI